MQRISVIGTSCCGKTTFAAELSAILDIPHIPLDDLHWGPSWTEAPPEVFRERVRRAAAAGAWIIDGNYGAMGREEVWSRADTIIWLDYGFPRVTWRAIRRTTRRVVRREACCNGNYETLRLAFSRNSILWWVVKTWKSRRRQYRELLPALRPRWDVIILRTPNEARKWLSDLSTQAKVVLGGS